MHIESNKCRHLGSRPGPSKHRRLRLNDKSMCVKSRTRHSHPAWDGGKTGIGKASVRKRRREVPPKSANLGCSSSGLPSLARPDLYTSGHLSVKNYGRDRSIMLVASSVAISISTNRSSLANSASDFCLSVIILAVLPLPVRCTTKGLCVLSASEPWP